MYMAILGRVLIHALAISWGLDRQYIHDHNIKISVAFCFSSRLNTSGFMESQRGSDQQTDS